MCFACLFDMTVIAPPSSAPHAKTRSLREKRLERGFVGLTLLAALVLVGLWVGLILAVGIEAVPAVAAYGIEFFTTATWNAVAGRETFGVVALMGGTLASSAIALLIAVPLGVGTAVFLTDDLIARPIRSLIGFLVELLAAIPSVVYGLWGIFVLIPRVQPLFTALHNNLGWIPLFGTAPLGPGLLPASMVLALMILPLIAAISRSALDALPDELRFAAMAVGTTRWEAIAHIQLPAAASGISGGILLALGRALGETMAITMLIGNVNQLSLSLFAPTNTIASLLASQFASARDIHISALMYAALVLMAMTLVVNAIAELIINHITRQAHGSASKLGD